MASLLRQIVAGPRARHEETGLDLCYVTSDIIATSGPSQTYPQRAYRNPLDRLVAFLDKQHGDNWAIWEFRGEGTGYPDEAVYGRIRHYPWPDHHPPPFRLVPMIMASMRNWLDGGDLHGSSGAAHDAKQDGTKAAVDSKDKKERVVVVHCKAGKGRSGSMACSFLISERGWTPEAALARFTERRMRPKFGSGVSIPSQLRWISYVDRWAKGGKKYVDRPFEIVEIHAWGLRSGVKLSVEGFAEEGRRIEILHTFTRDERIIVEGETPSAGGPTEVVPDVAKMAAAEAISTTGDKADYSTVVDDSTAPTIKAAATEPAADGHSKRDKAKGARHSLMRKLSKRSGNGPSRADTTNGAAAGVSGEQSLSATSLPNAITDLSGKATTGTGSSPLASSATPSQTSLSKGSTSSPSEKEPGGMAVIFKPREPIRVNNSDVNIALERRNRAPASMGLTMVTAVAHVWFNVFFEGNGPEQDGKSDDSGVFEIDWDKMDGIKGSSRKGVRGLDRMAVVWRCVDVENGTGKERTRGAEIVEPHADEEIPQMPAADWRGDNKEDPDASKHLGLRATEPDSENVSKASSIKSVGDAVDAKDDKDDNDSLKGVRASGPAGEELDHNKVQAAEDTATKTESKERDVTGRQPEKGDPDESLAEATAKKGFIVE